jgi:hypothetical protein
MNIADGTSVRVTTDPLDHRAILLRNLDNKAANWSRAPSTVPGTGVVVDPSRIQTVGRVSTVIDADIDGLDNLPSRRLVLKPTDDLAYVHAVAKQLGKREFARRADLPPTVAERAARGEPISNQSVARALQALRCR